MLFNYRSHIPRVVSVRLLGLTVINWNDSSLRGSQSDVRRKARKHFCCNYFTTATVIGVTAKFNETEKQRDIS